VRDSESELQRERREHATVTPQLGEARVETVSTHAELHALGTLDRKDRGACGVTPATHALHRSIEQVVERI